MLNISYRAKCKTIMAMIVNNLKGKDATDIHTTIKAHADNRLRIIYK